ncbi:hypothetical protein Kpol_1060p41 [Vanderwaltozyma polyspora DSM 70294]|uniref:MEMO1 family protein n=1 Tax=Vanderwaltozyma polyspora (strain ATCC 22028 / DSM 70294 / BCRC 21397 / CBS 2163 / NBRC 10782 / NRRL Y-8283 / UCD 57-17) TaxID=436907 RepID=A7TK39_VANPO|nr:uncharacterized protein Kpol_1060p41 [Vanderwaltozyma polyspora DSM 70294]EDO17385.1 hypothetical protein Kpol_1060p41 [Vanderwaltozyma polyspora DSM 70294]
MTSRPASHSSSWYSDKPDELSDQLQGYLNGASSSAELKKDARLIISPHAGYKYCGSTMAHSYASLDLNENIERIFILGPSHNVYFRNQIFLSAFETLSTPLGDLNVDTAYCEMLINSNNSLFAYMDMETDISEHSLEMQFPMLVKTIQWRKLSLDKIKVIPMMVSHNTEDIDTKIAEFILKKFRDPKNLFIISSDFCHWGRRFRFTGYVGSPEELQDSINDEVEIEMLTSRSKLPRHRVPIWESIKFLDEYAMDLLDKSENPEKYKDWKQYLELTGNTICGAKPIQLILKVIELEKYPERIRFEWPKYSQTSQVENVNDSSVSYASGYAII